MHIKKFIDGFKNHFSAMFTKELEINNHEPDTYMQVPFWAWQSELHKCSQILNKLKLISN